jgi:hypothetical protein
MTEAVLLDKEQIAARRIPLEDAEVSLGKNANWYCEYCKRKMLSELVYMRHHCEQKRRVQELISPTGQAAFGYYNTWMKMNRRSAQTSATFLESKFFKTFVKFAQMVIDANIGKPEKYMELMIAGDVDPTLWCRAEAYSIYLKWDDKDSDPIIEVQDSINYLFDICEKEGVLTSEGAPDITKVLSHLGPQRIIILVRQKRLTPWLLFCAPGFTPILRAFDKGEHAALDGIINSEYWAKKFAANKAAVNEIKEIATEIGL